MRHSAVLVVFTAVALFAQANTWIKLDQDSLTRAGCKNWASLVYSEDSNRFFSTMGWVNNGSWDPPARYSDLVLSLSDGRWLNFLPNDTLYGKWADITGNTLSPAGKNFETPHFKTVEGYLRPAVYFSTHKAFYQYAYDTDDQCVYYYLWNRTIRYSTRLRKWDTLVTTVQPATHAGGTSALIWGSLCYDPVNREVVLFGGGDIDAPGGHCGTWVYSPSANTWTKLNLAVQPPQRCLSQMVYDAKNHCIVMFGGDHLDRFFADTWVYDCTSRTWSQKHPARSPSPRAGHALLYLPKSQSVVLLGGYICKPTNPADGPSWYTGYKAIDSLELWRYDAAADEWKFIKSYTTAMVLPSWTFQSQAAADTGDRIVVLGDSAMYGGYIKNTYVMTCDPAQVDEAGTLAHGALPGALGLRTGAGDPAWFDSAVAPSRPDSLIEFYRTMPTNTWIRMTQPRMPYAGRDWSSRTWDTDNDQLLMYGGGHSAYCGTDIPQFSPSTNRWHIGYAPEFMIELNGDGGNSGNYTSRFTFQDRPFMPGHPRKAYCYSPVHKRMVSFNYGPLTYFYDPVRMDWDSTRRMRPDAATAWSTTTVCLVPTPYGVFYWKGNNPSPKGLYLLDSNLVWNTLPVNGGLAIPIYYDGGSNATYDPKRDRVLIFSSQTRIGQAWEYTFKDSTLTALNPTGDYDSAQTFWREAAYLPAQDKVIFMGTGAHRLYNCAVNQWELLTISKNAGVGTTCSWSSGYVYDPKRDLVWDCEQSGEINVLRVAGGYDPDSIAAARVAGPVAAVATEPVAIVPNPFNPLTRIVVDVPGQSRLTLAILDINGRIVARFAADGPRHTFTWDGKQTASGLYVFQVRAGKKSFIRKAVLSR